MTDVGPEWREALKTYLPSAARTNLHHWAKPFLVDKCEFYDDAADRSIEASLQAIEAPGLALSRAFKAYQACLSTSIYDMSREEREADQLKVEAAFKECRELAAQILQGGSDA